MPLPESELVAMQITGAVERGLVGPETNVKTAGDELIRIVRADRAAVLRWAAEEFGTLAEGANEPEFGIWVECEARLMRRAKQIEEGKYG